MYVHMYSMYACMYACPRSASPQLAYVMHVCMYVCMCACMHVYMYACMHACLTEPSAHALARRGDEGEVSRASNLDSEVHRPSAQATAPRRAAVWPNWGPGTIPAKCRGGTCVERCRCRPALDV